VWVITIGLGLSVSLGTTNTDEYLSDQRIPAFCKDTRRCSNELFADAGAQFRASGIVISSSSTTMIHPLTTAGAKPVTIRDEMSSKEVSEAKLQVTRLIHNECKTHGAFLNGVQ
jgi:hypothetical protein